MLYEVITGVKFTCKEMPESGGYSQFKKDELNHSKTVWIHWYECADGAVFEIFEGKEQK